MRSLVLVPVCCVGLLLGAATAFPSPAERAEKTARELVRNLSSADFAAAVAPFDERMASALPAPKLREAWHQVVAKAGDFSQVVSAHTSAVQGYTVVTLTCSFARSSLDVRVAVDSAGRVAGLFFLPHREEASATPPAEEPPAGVSEREVRVGAEPWQLPGTLSLPDGRGPFPAVVLVHGSGPNDRDETIGPNRPFRDLAWGLAKLGVAALRYDKRTLHYQARLAADSRGLTVAEETVDDARAAVALLASLPEVDAHRIVVLGHSLGGYLAPRIAAGDPRVAGLVVMAGSSRPLEELVVEQVKYLAGLDGKVDENEREQIAAAEEAARRIRDPHLALGDTVTVLGSATPASYWLDLRSYQPATLAATLHLPMLILQGERDYQVREADLAGWKAALAGRPRVTFKTYPFLNHLFMAGSGSPSPADYATAGHVHPEVIADIAAWVKALPETGASESRADGR